MKNAPSVIDPEFDQFSSPAPQDMQYERMREIRLSVTLSETRIPEGHFYMMDFDVPKGEKPVQTDLGTSITVNILRHAMKARKWDQQQNMTVVDSSEFRTFSDMVILYDVYSIPNQIIAALPYTHRNKKLPCIGGKGEGSLKVKLGLSVRYISYVLYEGEICRMNFTATDNSGADQDDRPLPFGKEAEDSFSGMLHSIDEGSRDKLFLYDVTLASKKHQVGTEKIKQEDGTMKDTPVFSKKLVLKTFKVLGVVPEDRRPVIKEHLKGLYKQISEQFWNKYTKAREATNESKLDAWSRMILDKIDSVGTDPLLYSMNDQVKVLPQEGQVIDVKMIAAPDTTRERQTDSAQQGVADVAAELEGGDSFRDTAPVDTVAAAREVFPANEPVSVSGAIGGGVQTTATQAPIAQAPQQADAQGTGGGVAGGTQPGVDGGKSKVRRKPQKPA